MNAKVFFHDIEDIINQAKVKNPFRYSPGVAKDFALNQGEEVGMDIFAQFLRDELMECADTPEKALFAVRMDLMTLGNILEEKEADDAQLSHPFFCPAQVSILRTYLGGDCGRALEEKTKKQALKYVNDIMSDRLLRLSLAAVDIRNDFPHSDLSKMFKEAAEQVARMEKILEKFGTSEEENISPRFRL